MDYQHPKWDRIFNNLLIDIRDKQCVLLLGPEVIRKGDISFIRHIYKTLVDRDPDNEYIAHFYEKDGFFLFNESGKEDMQRDIKELYKKHTLGKDIDDNIFCQIAEMPFHLILSLNPDAFLSDIYYKYGLKHRFGYFEFEGKAVPEVEEPTQETPLIYNLCGYKEKDASLILDYEDLFKFMQAILGTPGLPNNLLTSLKSAKTFICLGFDFEKWYSQILLQLLSGQKGKKIKKYAINKEIADPSTETFLVNQFGITFLGDDHSFFQQLYEKVKNEGMLRILDREISAKQDVLLRHIANNDLLKAFEILEKEAADKHAVTLLSAKYHNIEELRRKDTIDSRDYFVQFNKITDGLLELAKTLTT